MKAIKEEKSSFIEELYQTIGENDDNDTVSDYLTTGILPLNKIISGNYYKGLPVGRITEIYGQASAGKSLIATMALIETQKKGGIAVFFDYEYAFSSDRAVSLGLSKNKDKWIYRQPETAEDGFKLTETIINAVRKAETKKPITIVFDSIASMITKAEAEAKYDSNMKTKLSLASFMSVALKQIAAQASKCNITLIFLNQIRTNPSITFGSSDYTSGGNAMKFYASLRIELSKGKKIKDGDDVIGEVITAKTVKNKITSPFKHTTYISDFDMGVDLVSTHILALKDMGIFGDTQGWFEWEGKKYREKELVNKCRADKEFYDNILKNFV